MYPNPQEALPLPTHPSIEHYKKRAKELLKASAGGDLTAIRAWAVEWIQTIMDRQDDTHHGSSREEIEQVATDFAQFAHEKLSSDGQLADAQFAIARAHGFDSWPKFAAHVESLEQRATPAARFEHAADAIIGGDAATLARLLAEYPDLIRARSTREHNATLLHYVSANGVEGYRQRSPKNAAAITKQLLDAGAEVDAVADVYGGDCTALGLVATSAPPAIAGVQIDVMKVLLAHGARLDGAGSAGNDHSLVRACLANGQPAAAEYLATVGAPLDLPGAAGLGRVDLLQSLTDEPAGAANAGIADAFYMASAYGRANVVDFFLQHGIEVDLPLHGHGAGHTGLHVAAFHGHVDVVSLLLRHGANVHAIDKTWGTPPLIWAMTGWSREEAPAENYYAIAAVLVRAGATVKPDLLNWENVERDPKMQAVLRA